MTPCIPRASYRDAVADPTRRPGPTASAPGPDEFETIRRIAAQVGAPPAGEVWIGDDAAIVRVGGALLAIAADAVVAGVHADLALTSVADLGWKALAVNVSDLAAMGCVADRALVTVSGPAGSDVDGLYEGLLAAAAAFRCPIVGGDLTGGPGLVVSVSVIGDGGGVPPPVLRSGARPGDEIWLTGPVGAAAAGLRALRAGHRDGPLVEAHARPIPRIREGQVARASLASAMIDVSDGFSADLAHLLDASGVGCDLDGVPVAEGATEDDALAGGDDYQLVICCPADAQLLARFREAGLADPVLVGTCGADPGRRLLAGAPLAARGWVHPI